MTEVTPNTTTIQSSERRNTRRLWIVRHGQTDWNTQQRFCGRSDISLSAQGRIQANWLAEQLQNETIAALYASDLVRARETAEIIAQRRIPAVPVRVSAAWRELDFGDWEGLTYAQITEQFKDQLGFFTDPEFSSPPNGESQAHLQQRVKDALAAIVHSDVSPAGDMVLVSHGGPLRILLCSILGMPVQRQWRLRLDHGSLSAIDFLPVHETSEPHAVLALLNVQRCSAYADHSANSLISSEAASERRRVRGIM